MVMHNVCCGYWNGTLVDMSAVVAFGPEAAQLCQKTMPSDSITFPAATKPCIPCKPWPVPTTPTHSSSRQMRITERCVTTRRTMTARSQLSAEGHATVLERLLNLDHHNCQRQ